MALVALYREVLPDWSRLRWLDYTEVEAGAELLVVVSMAENAPRTTEQLQGAWLELFAGAELTERTTLAAHIDTTRERLDRSEQPGRAIAATIESACDRIASPITQFHLMCLTIVTAFLCGADRGHIEACYRVGRRFQISDERIGELFDRMWRAFRTAVAYLKEAGRLT